MVWDWIPEEEARMMAGVWAMEDARKERRRAMAESIEKAPESEKLLDTEPEANYLKKFCEQSIHGVRLYGVEPGKPLMEQLKSDWGVAVVETGSGAPIKELTVEWDKEGLTKTRIDGVTVKMTGAMSPSLLTDIQLLYTCI